MKKIMSLFLALVLVCSCMATSVFATPESFGDVPSDAYYHDAVLWAVQFGITAGVGENKFGPNNPCTRGQIMTMLWRAAGSPGHNAAESAFTDVNKGDYYYDAVLWAVENGVTAGVGDNKFGPSNPCTRAQIVTFLWKARGSHEPTNTANQFTDVASNAYYAKAVAWAVENKVTSGVGNNQFGPNQTCTRAQIVTFLWKADQITIPTPNPEPTEPPVTEPAPTEHVHSWTPDYVEIHHDAEYEDRPVYEYKAVYVCKKCGAQFDDVEECGDHCMYDCGGAYTAQRVKVQVGTEHVKVKDAWTEKIPNGEICSICGAHR